MGLIATEMAVHGIDIPVRSVRSHGSGSVHSIRSAIVEITTEDGLTGWGEASPWPVFTGSLEAAIAALDRYFKPLVVGSDLFELNRIMAEANHRLVGCSEAKAALETAILDLQGRALGVSVATLLGGALRNRMPMSFSIANPDFDADFDAVERLVDDNVRIFKLKTGFSDHRFDVMRLEKLRKAYGGRIDLRADYNQGLDAADAIRRLRDLEAFDLTFIEQPVRKHDLAAMCAITAAIDTPVMADESVFDLREAQAAIQMGVADLFSLKIMKSGGLRPALEIASLARTSAIGVYGGCMFETGLAHMAGAMMCAAAPELGLGCEFYMPTYYANDDILTEPFPVIDGEVVLPDGPGLGVEIDRQKLAHYRIE